MKIANIRTSDRIAFKRCRRKWDLSSGLRQNLTDSAAKSPLWCGTGFHFAMEDMHGENRYGHPVKAWDAYVAACIKAKLSLPGTFEEDNILFKNMLEYYVEWLKGRDPLKTFVYQGRLQTEVRFEIPLPIPADILAASGYDGVVYSGTLDRVIVDEHGRLFVLDYKTVARFGVDHLVTDPQISSYCWAGQVLYGKPVTGFIYQQHLKKMAEEPTFLASSQRYSTAKSMATTHRLYRNALIGRYGEVSKAPPDCVKHLGYLASEENQHMDALIRRDFEYRNSEQLAAEGAKIIQEAIDMINPNLPLYPNPTRDCSWDCAFRETCISMDDGSDWKADLATYAISRDESEAWRKYI